MKKTLAAASLAAMEMVAGSPADAQTIYNETVARVDAQARESDLTARVIVTMGTDYDIYQAEEIRGARFPQGYIEFAKYFAEFAERDSLLPQDWFTSILVSDKPLKESPDEVSRSDMARTVEKLTEQERALKQAFAENKDLFSAQCSIRPQDAPFACAAFGRVTKHVSDGAGLASALNRWSDRLATTLDIVACNSSKKQLFDIVDRMHGSLIAVTKYCLPNDRVKKEAAAAARETVLQVNQMMQQGFAADPVAIEKQCNRPDADTNNTYKMTCFYWKNGARDDQEANYWTVWKTVAAGTDFVTSGLTAHAWEQAPVARGSGLMFSEDLGDYTVDHPDSERFQASLIETDELMKKAIMPTLVTLYTKGNATDANFATQIVDEWNIGFDDSALKKAEQPDRPGDLRTLAMAVGRARAQFASFPNAYDDYCTNSGYGSLVCSLRETLTPD